MAPPLITTLNASGVFPIAIDPQSAGPDGWRVSFVPSSDWVGYVTVMQDQNAPGAKPLPMTSGNLTAVAWTNSVTGNTEQSATPIAGTLNITVAPPTFPLYANVVWTQGSLKAVAMAYTAASTAAQAANFSQITIDSIPVTFEDSFEVGLAFADAGGVALP